MTDSRKAMMDKFEKMKARQNAAKENRNRRLNQELCSLRGKQRKSGEVSSRRLKKKNIWNVEKKDDDMSSKRDRKYMTNLIDGIFMSLRERKRKRYIDEKCKKGKIKSISTPDETKLSRDFPSTDAQKESFCKFLSEIFGLGVQGLLQQYQTYLKTYVPPDVTRVAFDKNMERNRYKDVVCIDQTRVILKNTNQDYIHASHVRGEPFVNPFICTQGPMKNTVDDFWIMVMQERVSHIFMLCNVTESGKSRCAQYWPPDVGGKAEHAGVIIRNLHVDDDDSTLVITKLDAEGRGEHLSLKHLRWKNWPDKGVPLSVLAPFRLLTMSRQSTNRPTIVHCSAGIGRTGCIVATEMCIQLLLTLKPFSIIRAIQQLRTMRVSCVQTDTQFVYVVRCLLAYASTCGVMQNKPLLSQKAVKFQAEYDAYFGVKEAEEATAGARKESPKAANAAPAPPKFNVEPVKKATVSKPTLVVAPLAPLCAQSPTSMGPTVLVKTKNQPAPIVPPLTTQRLVPVMLPPTPPPAPKTSNPPAPKTSPKPTTTLPPSVTMAVQDRPELATLPVPKTYMAQGAVSCNVGLYEQQQQQRQQRQQQLTSLYVTRF